jgi:regulator of protease activity HflC (stomatin/prohibitin superfamily)
MDKDKKNFLKFAIIIGAIFLILIILLFCSIRVVPGGSTGVVVRLGAIQENTLNEGSSFVAPFITKVVKINNKVVRTDVTGTSASKDLQTVTFTVSVNYQVIPEKSAYIYRTLGEDYENVALRPAVQECVKSVVSKYTAEECITNRQELSTQMKEELNHKVYEYGMVIADINVINFDFSEEFNAAIEQKTTAQQNALKAEQDLARIKIEGEQKIAEAEAEAKANEIKNAQITDDTLKMKFIEKWNGELPAVVGSEDNLFNVDDFIK